MLSPSWWVRLVAFAALGVMGGPLWDAGAREKPWRDLLQGREDAKAHLRLAEGHARAGRCGAAIFHWRRFLRRTRSATLRKQVTGRIATCQRRSGWQGDSPRRSAGRLPRVVPSVRLGRTVRVPGGTFLVGSSTASRNLALSLCQRLLRTTDPRRCGIKQFLGEHRLRRVRGKPFRIDRTEVSQHAYLRCVRAGVCGRPPARFLDSGNSRLPVVGITWREARSFCRWRRGRLPSEQEWVRAARGAGVPARMWPWGRHFVAGCANVGAAVAGPGGAGKADAPRSRAVGTTPCDASPYGVLDLAGNVREWTRSAATRVPVRGGSFLQNELSARIAQRALVPPHTRRMDLGFRCVYK
ncbi:MAG: SUMF1/EgtB/PvdO family nonheme iron enzyme [bacterium]